MDQKKVLIVEDDAALGEIYDVRLKNEGYQVTLAHDGEEALQKVTQIKPDLVLSDVMMPKISGFDVLDVIRSTPETKDTKVIMMTALSGSEHQDRGQKLGVDLYMVKSQVGIEDIVNAVNQLLGGGTGTSTPTANVPGAVAPATTPVVPPAAAAPAAPSVPAPAAPTTAVPIATVPAVPAPAPPNAPAASEFAPPTAPSTEAPAATTVPVTTPDVPVAINVTTGPASEASAPVAPATMGQPPTSSSPIIDADKIVATPPGPTSVF
ncbi:response regulator [Candidatus Saccharibacteria bacterium]|nr:response regulator [Candidatus Saccharibacteria bacterium]